MRGTLVSGVAGCADWRSAAGERLLWFALGGGPPDFWEVPGPVVVSGRGPCRAVGVPPGKGFLGRFGAFLGGVFFGGVFFGWFAAVDDDLLNLARGVAPCEELVQVVPVGLGRGPP